MTRYLQIASAALLCGTLTSGGVRAQAPSSSPPASAARPLVRLALEEVLEAPASLSADGRYVAFETRAGLVPSDVNKGSDIYVLDRATGQLTLESAAFDGGSANGTSCHPRLSADARWLVFETGASNLIRESAGQIVDIVLRDRATGAMRAITRARLPRDASTNSGGATISADGRVVAFWSHDTELVNGVDANGSSNDVYVLTVDTGVIVRASVASNGMQPPSGGSFAPSLNADGTIVAFTSTADLARGGPATDRAQVWVRDLTKGTTRLVSATEKGAAGNHISHSASISGDGRMVAFVSMASNLGPSDDNRLSDVYVRDLQTGALTLVSRTRRDKAGNGNSSRPAMSGDGQFLAFVSEASDLQCQRRCAPGELDENLLTDVYLADLRAGTTRRVSGTAEQTWWAASQAPAIDAHGATIAFPSKEPIDPRDVEADFDLFVWTQSTLAGTLLTRR
jgi:Tol biopolymer transport system component